MMKDNVAKEYFEWLSDCVCEERYSEKISYRKLLGYLHHTAFRWVIPRDENRADDGERLRYRFSLMSGYEEDYLADYIDGPCSVLEMMVALAIRCEEGIMDDPRYGNRTGQWFWSMINSLGLGSMTDTRFNVKYVSNVIEMFMDQDYEPDGEGGLFRIKNIDCDLRNVEIWQQMCWYLDSISGY